jgi:hypothetical protein
VKRKYRPNRKCFQKANPNWHCDLRRSSTWVASRRAVLTVLEMTIYACPFFLCQNDLVLFAQGLLL